MKFARFWSLATSSATADRKGLPPVSCWGWSDESEADATEQARHRAVRVAERLATRKERLDRYGYGDRPLREPILREFRDEAGELTAVLTRNSYGCVVLNTARLMFVGIDLPELKRLFGRRRQPVGETAVEARVERLARWTRNHPDWGWRVYQTRAGLRLLATHALFEPHADTTRTVFEELGADPLYARLCRNQESFRARLTPKPWRCGWHACRVRWPFADTAAENRFHEWERHYLQRSNAVATCRFLQTVGRTPVHEDIASLLRLHDETTRADSGLPLA